MLDERGKAGRQSLGQTFFAGIVEGAGEQQGARIVVHAIAVRAIRYRMRRVLEQADRLGLGTVTLILHSFSLLKIRDLQYCNTRPDWIVISRLRNLCRFLASRREQFRVVTFDDALDLSESEQEPPLPDMGAVIPAVRKVVQGINRAYWI